MPNIIINKEELLDERLRDRNLPPEMLILQLYVGERERNQNRDNSHGNKKYSFRFYGSNDNTFYLLNYGVNSLHDGEPEKTVLKGELVRAREIAGKIFISYQIAEVEYKGSFYVEDVIRDARDSHSMFSQIVDELWMQKKVKKGKEAEELQKKIDYAHDLAVEYNGAEYFFRDLQRDYFTYGEEAIVKYFENGTISRKGDVGVSDKSKKYGDLTRQVDKLIMKYNCIRHKTVAKELRVKMLSELRAKGFESISDATLRTTLQRKGFSIEKRLR